jgi:exonuclease VII large subunit
MRVSVLNDAKHPTNASKYWQSVREMSAHFDALMNLSFDLRKNTVENLRYNRQMEEYTEDPNANRFDIMELEIDIDRNLYDRSCMLQVAKDRVRELSLWSTIKKELDDNSFDAENVNTHQAESLHRYFENRVKSLNDSSAPGEIINAMGPYLSFNRLKTDDGKLRNFLGEVSEDTKKKLN